MSQPRLGEPIELPWWVVPLGLPPLGIALAALVVSAPLWARGIGAVGSVLMLWLIVQVAHRVRSASMQSVWISAAYAGWTVVAVAWLVAVLATHGSSN